MPAVQDASPAGRTGRGALTTLCVGVAAVGTAVAAVATSSGHPPPRRTPATNPAGAARSRIAPGGAALARTDGPASVAVAAGTLYVADDAELRAFDRRTGLLRAAVRLPQTPEALRIGPDGGVWLALDPDAAHAFRPAVWRFAPDLARRTVLTFAAPDRYGAAPFDVLPTGPVGAVVATDHGLARVTMPSTAQPAGTVDWRAFPPLPAYPVRVTADGRELAVVLDNDAGSWLAAGGSGGWRTYVPPDASAVWAAAATPAGVWAVHGRGRGALARLTAQLRAAPEGAVAAQVRPAGAAVWSSGSTVWVPALAGLTCLRWLGPNRATTATLRLPGQATAVAPAADDVYVVLGEEVRAYPVPPPCRG